MIFFNIKWLKTSPNPNHGLTGLILGRPVARDWTWRHAVLAAPLHALCFSCAAEHHQVCMLHALYSSRTRTTINPLMNRFMFIWNSWSALLMDQQARCLIRVPCTSQEANYRSVFSVLLFFRVIMPAVLHPIQCDSKSSSILLLFNLQSASV